MKKIIATLSALIIALSINNTYIFATSKPPEICEDSVVLMDATTGDILFSKNMDTAYPPASTTKIMTALLTLELCKLDAIVTVGKNPPIIAARTSNISLVEGEQLTVKELLYGLILQSGNDCAETLAEYIGGTSANFATMMNMRAKELGCKNTNFVNPSGLYNLNHKTSGKDLALIMRALSTHPEFKEISTTVYHVIPPNNKYPKGHPMSNENKIVKYKDYAIPGYEGSKTGYTTESLYSFVAVASRNGQKLIVSLVHGKKSSFYSEAKELLNYGFDNFELVPLYNKGAKILDYPVTDKLSIPLLAADNYYFVREKGSKDEPTFKYSPVDLTNKSFKTGDKLLTLNFTLGTKALISLDLNSGIDHLIKAPIVSTKAPAKSSNIKYYIISIIFILIISSVLFIRKKRLRKKRLRRFRQFQ